MNSRHSHLALLAAAALCLFGFTRSSGEPQAKGDSHLLITSTIGGASAFLFVVDPVTRNLAAYEATPGETGGLRLLGARKIEHDLELARFNDLSKWSPDELERMKQETATESGDATDRKAGGRESDGAQKRGGG